MSFFPGKGDSSRNIIECTDGVHTMVGRYLAFISCMKSAVPGHFAIHYIVHCEPHVAKLLV